MITVQIRKPFLSHISKKAITSAIMEASASLFPGEISDLGILITSDAEIKELNEDYRHIDRATDVLSFGSEEIDPETGRRYLGDLVVSYETAAAQASVAGHDALTEIKILLIHGLLHLHGYDHDTTDRKQAMWQKQFQAHKTLGIAVTSLSGENDQPA